MEIQGTNFLQRRIERVEQQERNQFDKPVKQPLTPKKKKVSVERSTKKSGFNWVLILLILITIGLAGGLGYLYWQYQKTQKEVKDLKDPTKRLEIEKEESQRVIDALCKLIKCPNEKPTVATIIDIDTLKKDNPEFYKDAKNGDRIIVFTTKAIIFRTEENMIINIAPVIYTPNQNQQNKNEEQ